ncbi:MAG: FKBP-type peptidyl-prolyl cis-trans isomerase [Bacteroidota bacterium]
MKSFLYVLPLLLFCILFSCEDVIEPEEQLEIDKQVITEYVAANGLNGTFTESGLYYVIADSGVGTEMPVPTSTVEIIYLGTLLDGTEFDSSDGFPAAFPILNLIQGWQEGLLHFKRESEGILLVPSRLAYGPQGRVNIPPNSVLRFDIEMLDFE